MKNRSWAILFACLLALMLLVWRLLPANESTLVGVYQDGKLITTIALAHTQASQRLEIPGTAGGNTIEISADGVRVVSAGCPDLLCVEHGFLISGTGPIVCLPNRLVIAYLDEKENSTVDAVAGGRSLP